jgi:hypothetical protein
MARLQSDLFSFHQEEAAARRSEATPNGPAKRPEDRAQGLHKTSIYNILPMAGQTSAYEKGKRNPVSLGISARHVLANRW